MAEGLSHILKSLTWYMALSRPLLKNVHREGEFASFRMVMKDRVVELYQCLLEYQIKCTIRHFASWPIVQVVKAALGLEDWDGTFKNVQKLEEAIRNETKSYNDEVMKGFATESNKYFEDMVSHLREMNRQRQQELTGKFNSGSKGYMERNNPKPVQGTCMWFKDHEDFQKWTYNESNLLIVSADPGCGKSVLSRHLVESVLPQKCPNWFICHFFFKDEGDQKNLSTGLSCVIHQLLSQAELLSEPAKKVINEAGNGLDKWRTLWDILLLLLKEIDNVVILFDAFDEMDPNDFKELTKKLKEDLSSDSIAGSNTKVLITTRPYDFITNPLKSIQSRLIHLQGEGEKEIDQIQGEIKLVIKHRLGEFRKACPYLKDEVINALENSFERTGKNQKTYLWVKLAFELLEEDQSLDGSSTYWQSLVDTISEGHIEVYEQLLQRVSAKDKEDVRIVLSIIIAAASPLTTQQLDVALAVRQEFLSNPKTQYEDEKSFECRGDRMEKWIRNTCRCFVTVYDSRVHFIHQTAKEFLLRLKSELQPPDKCWHKSITLNQADAVISECWIAYVCIVRFPSHRIPKHSFARVFLTRGLLQFRQCQVFETTEASTYKVSDVSKMFQSSYYALLDQPIDDQKLWLYEMYGRNFLNLRKPQVFQKQPFPVFNILFAAFFGHYNALVHIVSQHQHLHCAHAERAVIAAAAGGNLECLQYLLSQQYPVTISFTQLEHVNEDRPGLWSPINVFEQTALHWAAIWGNRKMAQVLIRHGADINARGEKKNQTAIVDVIRGSWSSNHQSAGFYLARMSPSQKVTAQSGFSYSGCDEGDWDQSLMKYFVENGATLDDALSDRSILYHAVECGDENAVKFLLDNCHVDPNKGRYGPDDSRTPLHQALEHGSNRIFLLLLGAGANPSILCNRRFRNNTVENFSTLHAYTPSGDSNEEILPTLLKSGGKQVLHAKTTLRKHPDSENMADWDGATCLHSLVIQTKYGHVPNELKSAAIKYLVHQGAKINEPNVAGRTVLHLACFGGDFPLANALLALGADPTWKDNKGWTPLDIAQGDDQHRFFFISNSYFPQRLKFLRSCNAHLEQLGRKTTGSTDIP